MKQIIGEPKKYIKIWLPDSQEEAGGIWVIAKVCDVIITYENIVIEDNFRIDIESTLESFEGYEIEEIK